MILEASPNLYDLTIHFDALQSFFDDDSVCRLLGQRITHTKIILYSESIEQNTFPMARLASIFPRLKCLCFEMEVFNTTSELFILAAFNHFSEWKSLISFSVLGMVMIDETIAKDIHQWVLENISESYHNSFLTNYTDYEFRLWL
jgi:hypothetical protein